MTLYKGGNNEAFYSVDKSAYRCSDCGRLPGPIRFGRYKYHVEPGQPFRW